MNTTQQLAQGSEEWLTWRRQFLGATDTPAILGVSPYKTAHQLWEEKLGLSEPVQDNTAMARGRAMESVAREHYELETNIKMEPTCMVSKEVPFLSASLDGWNADKRIVLEIKNPGHEAHMIAVGGEVPAHYWWQMQHQLLVADAQEGHYWSFDGESGALVHVHRNNKAVLRIIKETTEFWNDYVTAKTPPPLTDRDYKKVTNLGLQSKLAQIRTLTISVEKSLAELKTLKDDAVKLCDHPRVECYGFKIVQSYRRGNVDYKAIGLLNGVDLEPFRRKGTTFVRFLDSEKTKVKI